MNKKITILGGGISGRAALKLAETLGDAAQIINDAPGAVLPDSDLIITSPGMHPLKSSLYQAALKSGTEFISEMEWGFRHFKGRLVAVTGTNGKTTTTELTVALLQSLGYDARPAGNIGVPLSVVAASPHDEHTIAVVEVSSFQLERCDTFAPEAAVLLNLASDHEDRYAGGYAEYCAVKRGIFKHVPEPNRIWGLSFAEQGHLATIQNDQLCWDNTPLLNLAETHLNAAHNRENLAAATELVFRIAGERVRHAEFAQAVKAFKPGAHRIENFLTVNDIRYIDDSKGTNPAAVQAAVNATRGPIVLLLGGLDKGMHLGTLLELTPKLRGAVVFGACHRRMHDLLEGHVPCFDCKNDFALAVQTAVKLAQPGDAVMLSPACASMDMFKDYADRGDQFQQLAREFAAK